MLLEKMVAKDIGLLLKESFKEIKAIELKIQYDINLNITELNGRVELIKTGMDLEKLEDLKKALASTQTVINIDFYKGSKYAYNISGVGSVITGEATESFPELTSFFYVGEDVKLKGKLPVRYYYPKRKRGMSEEELEECENGVLNFYINEYFDMTNGENYEVTNEIAIIKDESYNYTKDEFARIKEISENL